MIATAEEAPRLADLAARAGMSPFHFHRLFKTVAGVTPKAYAAQMQARRAADRLLTAGTVTEAIYDAGFNSSSRFYETAAARLGMTPTAVEARRRGRVDPLRHRPGLARRGAGGRDRQGRVRDHARRRSRRPRPRASGSLSARRARRRRRRVRAHGREVVGLVEAPGQRLDLPLDIRGTAFQERVWQALRAIPPGRTASYAEIARRGRPAEGGARGGAGLRRQPARGRDPLPPRGANATATLSGYRWGVERKRALLAREAA